MTVAAAWIRTISSCRELVFVSDSRLSGDGRNFDACPKILTLPRSDCAIAFAGYSGAAYPMIQQLALAIDAHAPARRRSLDLTSLKSHALKIFDGMASEIRVSPHLHGAVDTTPGAEFLFGGYDWIKKRFEIWAVKYNVKQAKFVAHPPRTLVYLQDHGRVALASAKSPRAEVIGRVAFAGDQAKAAVDRLIARYPVGVRPSRMSLDWEPFEVVRDMLRDPQRSETIGGPPQVAKVYEYMDTTALGVYWPNRRDGNVHLQGRRCLGYERVERFVLDPDTFRSEAMPQPSLATQRRRWMAGEL